MKKCPDCQQVLKGWEVYCPKCSKELSKHGEYKNTTQTKRWNFFFSF